MADPAWTVAKLDVDADVARGKTADTAEVAATDPNLKPFVASGGKLLLWHGWTDGLIPAQNTIDYYESALAATGADQSKDSVRLFMVPGVDHCSGGESTCVVDALGVIDTWVEGGKPPERIVASRPLDGGSVRTRPLCQYPRVARYRGQGSTDDASNFACMPEPAPIGRAPGRRH